MASRPCKPDADAKQIWRLLLPDTPFPACGVRENVHAIESAAPANEATTELKIGLTREAGCREMTAADNGRALRAHRISIKLG